MPVARLGLIGCGRIAQVVHLNILTRLEGAELVAVAEPDPDRREEARGRAGAVIAFADYRDLLALRDVDGVVICLPTTLHAEVAVAALEHGKHVYLEKPLARDLDEGRRVLSAWRAAGTVGRIGFNYRFNPLYQRARAAVRSGRLGTLTAARSIFGSPVRETPAWLRTRATGGGALLEYGSHHVDLAGYLFDQPVRAVFAQLRSQHTEHDTAVLQLRLADGLIVDTLLSTSAADADRWEIYGQAGSLTLDRYHSLNVELVAPQIEYSRRRRVVGRLRAAAGSPFLRERLLAPSLEPSYHASLAGFAGQINGGSALGPDFADGYRSLAVLMAAEESARTGCLIELPDPIELPESVDADPAG